MAATKISCILKQKRNELGLTPQDVIAALKERGIEIKEKALYAYENGDNSPKVNTFIALCDIYKISDVMGEFGYSNQSCTVPLATKSNEWSVDQYNDFFDGSLLEKIYLLIKHGVPSFAGYEKRLEECFPTDAEAANFEKLYNCFRNLNELAQGIALENIQKLSEALYPPISEKDLIHISDTTNTPVKILQKIASVLADLNADGLEMLRIQIGLVAGNNQYLKADNTRKKSRTAVLASLSSISQIKAPANQESGGQKIS